MLSSPAWPACRYADAAKLRDMLAALDRQAKQAAAIAAEQGPTEQVVRLRLGQRVVHRQRGYRGVVVGWDVGCCEDEAWQEAAGTKKLKNGLRWDCCGPCTTRRGHRWTSVGWNVPALYCQATVHAMSCQQG